MFVVEESSLKGWYLFKQSVVYNMYNIILYMYDCRFHQSIIASQELPGLHAIRDYIISYPLVAPAEMMPSLDPFQYKIHPGLLFKEGSQLALSMHTEVYLK